MTTQRALAALVVLVGVVALGAAAAGMDEPQRGSPSDVVGDGPGDGPGQSGSGDESGGVARLMASVPGWVSEWFMVVAAGGLSLVGILVMAYILWRERLKGLLFLLVQVRDVIFAGIVLVTFVALLIYFGFDLSTFSGDVSFSEPNPGGGSEQAEEPQTTGTGLPPVIVVSVVVLLAAIAILGIRRWRRSDDEDEPAEAQLDLDVEEATGEPSAPTQSPQALVEQTPDNSVYRAWYDLATHVGLAQERNRTPGEIEETAIQQGLPSDAVSTITDLFSEVRYGHRPVTDERERRAKSAMQSIEGTGSEA